MTDGSTAAGGHIAVDGRSVEAHDGDSVAVAIIRAGEAPARGGTLCLAGDCGNCLAIIDGLAYTRTCQVPARPGTVVERHPVDGNPPLPEETAPREIEVSRWAPGQVVIGG
ncbi:MAG TPA: 2Fe-2S iron-sulfur cluster-binding protein, partial [Candidatus Saccharimonadales bacterium]|nr:2Fe-2S iron-sulfur cluster-binding protein [Candidatus Saccharimonadales bacterium]